MNDAMLLKLKQLKLSGIAKTIDMRNEQALKDNMSYMEFMELLISDEFNNRQNNAIKRRVQSSRFPQSKTLEEYNFRFQPSIDKRFIYNLGTCEFVRKKENVAFIGPPGTGKTHLAIALGTMAIKQGYNVLFTTVNNMLEELYISRADNSFHQKLKHYIKPDLLILDELGLRKLNQNNVDDFYEIISRRYEQGSIIITSNKVFDEWGKIFYDPVLATAILDRFVHHCNFVLIKGDSYRMKQQEKTLKAIAEKEAN